MSAVKAFRGLNNVTDPMRLGAEWLVQANNINISDTGALARRAGHAKTFSGSITGSHATRDFKRMYVVDGGALKAMTSSAAAVTLKTGLSTAPMYWAEVNEQVFFNNGVDSGIIQPDGAVLDWAWQAPSTPVLTATTGNLPAGTYQVRCAFRLADGRVTGGSDPAEIVLTAGQALSVSSIQQIAGLRMLVYVCPAGSTVYSLAGTPTGTAMVWNASPESLGADLLDDMMAPLPAGCDVIQFWRGRAYAAQYLPSANSTVVWYSQPLGFHLFNLARDFFVVPGRVRMLAPHDDALIVGTDERVYAYNSTDLAELAPYGVPPGWHWSEDGKRVIFWSKRGLCAFFPFANLTERQVSVAPGVSAGGTVLLDGGQKRYLVAIQQGGSAFNSYT